MAGRVRQGVGRTQKKTPCPADQRPVQAQAQLSGQIPSPGIQTQRPLRSGCATANENNGEHSATKIN